MVTLLPEALQASALLNRAGIPDTAGVIFGAKRVGTVGSVLGRLLIGPLSERLTGETFAPTKKELSIITAPIRPSLQTRGPQQLQQLAQARVQQPVFVPRTFVPSAAAQSGRFPGIAINRERAAFIASEKEREMGFFSSIIKGITSVGRGLLGLPARAATVARAAPRVALAAGGAAAVAGGAIALAGDDDGAMIAGGTGGNGDVFTRTVIQTLNRQGQVVRQRIERGSPFLMNRDLAIAKRVIRTVGKLGGKFRRTKSGPSKMKQLTDKVIDTAICTVTQKALAPVATC